MTTDPIENKISQVKEEEQINKNPVTPRKRGWGEKLADSDPEEDNDLGEGTATKKSKSPSKKSGVLGPIPMTYEEASETDKLIIRMKEVDLKGWSEIQKAVEESTGAKVGGGIRMRYSRMKSNFVIFEKDDEPRLLETKKEIEERFEAEKWQKVAEGIKAKGGSKYPSSVVQKKFKELSKSVAEPHLLLQKKEIEEKMDQEKWQRIADGIEAMGGSKYPSSTVQKKYKQMAKTGNGIGAGAGKEE